MCVKCIIFDLNDQEKIFIETEGPLEALPCYCRIPVVFSWKNKEYLLSQWGLPEDVIFLRNILIKALNNELQLHESITQDFRYLNNIFLEHNQERALDDNDDDYWLPCPGFVYPEDNCWFWIGMNYQVWRHRPWVTWMYNDKNGNIILEITPEYPYLFTNGKRKIKKPFQEWLKSYKPLVVRIVPVEVAVQWLEQANKIIAIIEQKWDKAKIEADDITKMRYEECPRNK